MQASYCDGFGITHPQSNARLRSVLQPDRLRTFPWSVRCCWARTTVTVGSITSDSPRPSNARTSQADQKAEIVGWSARLHRRCAWRPEPLGHQAIRRMGAAKAKACRGSLLRLVRASNRYYTYQSLMPAGLGSRYSI